MSRLDVVHQFVHQARNLQTNSELYGLLHDITVEIGFRYFAITEFVDLRSAPKNIVHLDNCPAVWKEKFIENGYFLQDPILCASLMTAVGFMWSDVPKMIDITSKQKIILESAAKHGLGDGFTVPANLPGERSGSCSFATRSGIKMPKTNYLMAQLIGAFAFQAARRLNRTGDEFREHPTQLTSRQRDCLIWAIKGKTDWEIGRILGLSKETVAQHLETARIRYGASKRLQLAVRAIFDGQISFIEALF